MYIKKLVNNENEFWLFIYLKNQGDKMDSFIYLFYIGV